MRFRFLPCNVRKQKSSRLIALELTNEPRSLHGPTRITLKNRTPYLDFDLIDERPEFGCVVLANVRIQ